MDNLTLSDIIPELGAQHDPADFEKSGEWHLLLNLTYAVWRVSDAAVENDFLRQRIKHTAADILARYPSSLEDEAKIGELEGEIRTARALLALAQRLSAAREVNFVVLRNEYKKISALLRERVSAGKAPEEKRQSATPQDSQGETRSERSAAAFLAKREEERGEAALSERQQKIIQFFQKEKDAKVKLKEVMQFFPNLTDRTIRNDLRELCLKRSLVRSNGHGQASFYRLAK